MPRAAAQRKAAQRKDRAPPRTLPTMSNTQREALSLRVAVLTVSDTRTRADDESGAVLSERLVEAGHTLSARTLVKDDLLTIRAQLSTWIDAPEIQVVLVTGGTGVTARDITPEALAPLVTKPIPGFGELFRWLSYEEIGTSTIQSRAEAALCAQTYVFLLPGSPGACRTAWDRILVQQLDIRHRPCNFAELIDRL